MIKLIEASEIFPQTDNQMLKRMAEVVSQYGTTGDLSQGGIWQVPEKISILSKKETTPFETWIKKTK